MIKQAHAISEELIEWRRDFHMHPETGFDLHRTAAIVADELEKMGYKVKRGVGKTGVVAEIGEGGKLVAIRADMDALPIFEQNETDYVSQNEGKMHACGHDSHTAMALGAAKILAKEKLNGRIRFLFQPCEETADEEGKSGAQRMYDEGAVEGVDYVIAQHVDPTSPVGTIAINEGPSGGGVSSWQATIYGKGGHGAYPHSSNDPFVLLAHVIMGVNAIVSRRLDPFEPAVISIGAVNGGFTENVIPDKVELKGTIRFTSLEVEKQIREELTRVFEIVKVLGGDYKLNILFGGMPIINDKLVADTIAQVGKDLLGEGSVHPLEKTLGAEDFPEFLKDAPGAMYTLGTRIEGRPVYELHHPKFDLDERALPVGTAVLAETALRFLKA
ncbi:MAG: amidohydrolase [Anaerolineales bacterium]|uniref:M20 metallopeptidase family protein n=1 Tax=Candidatus Villigracilis vicinus TaxID=3140679 RepID=UPI003134DF69|nr:amidohydrolase [Anaerolineales bacterium]MBK7448539.1 amidohydrolase [Anaerolineales bacterium]MBK9782544.1 amidohydrolase [Anaerolineales bacterium]